MKNGYRKPITIICALAVALLFTPLVFGQVAGLGSEDRIAGILELDDQLAGISSGGAAFSMGDGLAAVDLANEEASFSIQGLAFPGNSFTGTLGSLTQVKGTLVCDPFGTLGGPVVTDTALASIDECGNAFFRGGIVVPGICANTEEFGFLIRDPFNVLIAQGILRRPIGLDVQTGSDLDTFDFSTGIPGVVSPGTNISGFVTSGGGVPGVVTPETGVPGVTIRGTDALGTFNIGGGMIGGSLSGIPNAGSSVSGTSASGFNIPGAIKPGTGIPGALNPATGIP